MREHELTRGLRYHVWASDRVMNSLRREWEPPQDAVDLFAHVVSADLLWLNRSNQTDLEPEQLVPKNVNRIDLAETWNQVRELWLELLEKFDDSPELMSVEIDQIIDYANTKGDNFRNSFGEILQHVINHGTHHRAQISRILREAGDTPPVLDMIAFLREPDRS